MWCGVVRTGSGESVTLRAGAEKNHAGGREFAIPGGTYRGGSWCPATLFVDRSLGGERSGSEKAVLR